MNVFAQYAMLAVGIGLSGYAAARPVQAETQGDRLAAWMGASGLVFFSGLVLIIAAAMLMRASQKKQVAAAVQHEAGDPRTLLSELVNGAGEVHRALAAEQPDTTAVCGQIDALRDGPIQGLVDCRNALVARHGMMAYAQFISAVSGAERNLNRAWSTLVDGYPREAERAAEKAVRALEAAQLPY